MKRIIDVVLSCAVLLLFWPVLVAAAILVKISSPGPVIFRHRRVGRYGRSFNVLKFRTMRVNGEAGRQITVAGDPRITPLGSFLRRSRLDELPQFWNILRGDMSCVGPRPETPEYVALYSESQRPILDYCPGLTDPATLHYFNEAEMLAGYPDPDRAYIQEILPRKLTLSLDYARKATLTSDLAILARTAALIVARSARKPSLNGGH